MSNDTVLVEYVGEKERKVDNIAGTGTVWHGKGDVQPCSLAAWGKLSAYPTVWRAASAVADSGLASAKVVTPPPPAPAKQATASTVLYGGDFPALIDIDGIEIQLGAVVAAAHEESGLSVDAWNALDAADRQARLQSFIERARVEAAEERAKEDAARKGAEEKAAEPLTHEQLKAELKRLGVPFKGNPSKATLQALYDQHKG